MLYVTTSWDDGSVHDVKLAELLTSYGIKGTFYVSKSYPSIGQQLNPEQIKKISLVHEIGAHTLSHPDLTTLDEASLRNEIAGSKEWLETIIDAPVKMFCYPSGRYNAAALDMVREAGFSGARTTRWPSLTLPAEPYEMQTTLPIYPLPFRKLAGSRLWWRKLLQPLFERAPRLRKLGVSLWYMSSWQRAARVAFDYAFEHGQVFHLWGHSWEIENYGMWGELEQLLSYISSKKEVKCLTNSELSKLAEGELLTVGGWTHSTRGLNNHSIIYSFGAGTDIQWDLALIEKLGLNIYAFDPSERSIAWLKEQTLPSKFVFKPVGLSDHEGTDIFYTPPNPKNVSYSTVRKVGNGIEFPVQKLSTIMRELGHDHIDILKIDIEGSEYAVLEDILAERTVISQILVEFHDRFAGKGKTERAIQKLEAAGYKILYASKNGEEYSFIKE